MKVLRLIIEILTAPFALIFRTSESIKVSSNSLSKPFITFIISLLIVALVVLYFYSDYIFK